MPVKQLFLPALIIAALSACATNSEKSPAPVEEVALPETTPAPAAPPIAREQTPEPEPASLQTVFYFEFDQARLSANSKATLREHAQRLVDTPRNIRIEGHSDERGSTQYNLNLGQKRANAVRDFLISNGVSASQIETVSFGEQNPHSNGNYEAAWQQNRRVELKL